MISGAHISKTYTDGKQQVHAINNASFHVSSGTLTALTGRSGSGKSTLFNIISGIDPDYEGSCQLFGKEVKKLSEEERLQMRREKIGIIFQNYNLIDTLTLYENCELAFTASGKKKDSNRINEVLKELGLIERKDAFPKQMSGGEQQRAAIARVLLSEATLILADEPTGALDQENTEQIFSMLQDLVRQGKTVLLITHDPDLAQRCSTQLKLSDGRILHEQG